MTVRPALALAALVLAFVLGAIVPERAGGAGSVTIQLTQIRASERGSGAKDIDQKLEDLRRQLENFPYRVFRRVGLEAKTVADGTEASFALHEGGFKLTVRPSEGGGGFVLLDLAIRTGEGREVMSTRLKLKDGGTALLAKQLEVGNGVLLLAFTVRRA